jgi:uncharacterized membrane protein (UPF0127 family)
LNLSRGTTVCERAVLADRPLARMRGLLGRRELPAGEGLLLTPAPSIHTAFMRFEIDVLFLDADLRVLRIVERLHPWRAVFHRHARSVLELSAGEVLRAGTQVGDRLQLTENRAPKSEHVPAGAEPIGAAALDRPEASMHVMVLSSDRRFREVVSLLLARRGCAVSAGEGTGTLAERIDRDRTQVVVIDAGRSLAVAARMAAAVEALSRPVGIVVVGDQPESVLTRLETIPKWGSFDELFAAVRDAHAEREHRTPLFEQATNGASS